VIAVVLVGGGLFLLVGWMRLVREDARTQLARELMVRLDRALAGYFEAEHKYPVTFDDDADAVVAVLLRHPRARAALEGLPESFWTETPPRTLIDSWGTPLRYHGDAQRPDVRANGGRPIFVSAGRDRAFGELDVSGLADDLRSDDPPADGYAEAEGETERRAATRPSPRPSH